MNRDMERHKEFSRRAFLLGMGKFALFMTLTSRLAYLQIVEQSKFKTLSDKNRISIRLLSPRRGEIVDRFEVPLAINRPDFRAFMIAEQAGEVEKVLDRLSDIIPISEDEREYILKEVKANKRFTPVLVKENLSWEDMAKVESRMPDFPGIKVEEGIMRSYPLSTATAHLIGYMGLVSRSEVTDDPVTRIPGFRIGKTGVEKKYEEYLRGKAGRVNTEVNASGREIRELERDEGVKGDRIGLTLDSDLQMQVQEYLSEQQSASAVVMDAHNGEIYAMCSYPSFDPNVLSTGVSPNLWEDLLSDSKSPLTNKVISGQYPPGSTFKMIVALAALEAGVITESTMVTCTGEYRLGRGLFHCWREHGHGPMNVVSALRESCDVFFYEIGRRVGIDKIVETARKFGLGSPLGFEIPIEASGLVPDREWKEKHFKEPWQMGETIIAAIGQGYLLSTPLQLATMTARLVNGGFDVSPSVIKSIGTKVRRLPEWESLGFSSKNLNIVRKGMEQVVNHERGTAYWTGRITNKNRRIGGKTGTSQVKRITKKERDEKIGNKTLPWKFRHHGLFVAYGPVEHPQYVTAVVVEHGGGAAAATPIAKKIMDAVQRRDPRLIRGEK